MTPSNRIAAPDLLTELSEGAILAALKLQLEGLAVLFGGTAEPAQTDIAKTDAMAEALFDNMPV